MLLSPQPAILAKADFFQLTVFLSEWRPSKDILIWLLLQFRKKVIGKRGKKEKFFMLTCYIAVKNIKIYFNLGFVIFFSRKICKLFSNLPPFEFQFCHKAMKLGMMNKLTIV